MLVISLTKLQFSYHLTSLFTVVLYFMQPQIRRNFAAWAKFEVFWRYWVLGGRHLVDKFCPYLILLGGKYWRTNLSICGKSYKGSMIVNYDSRVVPIDRNYSQCNSRAVIYDRRVLTRLATGHTGYNNYLFTIGLGLLLSWRGKIGDFMIFWTLLLCSQIPNSRFCNPLCQTLFNFDELNAKRVR